MIESMLTGARVEAPAGLYARYEEALAPFAVPAIEA